MNPPKSMFLDSNVLGILFWHSDNVTVGTGIIY